MTKLANYKIIPEAELMIANYSGQIGLDDMIAMNKKIVADRRFNPHFNIIVDIRKLDYILKFSEAMTLADYYRKNYDGIASERVEAILTTNENQTAGALLFEKISDDLPMRFKTVVTTPAAFDWVGVKPEYADQIERELENLKKVDHIQANN